MTEESFAARGSHPLRISDKTCTGGDTIVWTEGGEVFRLTTDGKITFGGDESTAMDVAHFLGALRGFAQIVEGWSEQIAKNQEQK